MICVMGTFWKSISDSMGIEYKEFLVQEYLKDGFEFLEYISVWAKENEVGGIAPYAVNICWGPADTLARMPLPFILQCWRPSS